MNVDELLRKADRATEAVEAMLKIISGMTGTDIAITLSTLIHWVCKSLDCSSAEFIEEISKFAKVSDMVSLVS